MRDHPLASRLLIMLGAFALLVPIGLVIRDSKGNVVRAGGLPGAVLAADPLIVASTTTSPPVIAAATTTPTSATAAADASAGGPAPTAAMAPPPTAAATVAPATSAAKAPATSAKKAPATPAKKAPATTAAKKATATTAAPAPKVTAPPSTKAPATAAPKATAPPTTSPPTTAAPPANKYSANEVETIIRSVFPADQADEAVRIARRESHLVPTARNWCCYGLFQIYFKANQSTLASIGITAAEQLFDPRLNAEAAYLLYQRSGWAPWQ